MQGGELPERTGVAPGETGTALFGVRGRSCGPTFADISTGSPRIRRAAQWMTFTVPSGTFTMTRRKLASHILLHEIRHLAQIAYAARLAGTSRLASTTSSTSRS